MSDTMPSTTSQVAELKKRVADIRPYLPKNWRERLGEKSESFDISDRNHQMYRFITNVHAGKSTSRTITELLEEIANDFKAEINENVKDKTAS